MTVVPLQSVLWLGQMQHGQPAHVVKGTSLCDITPSSFQLCTSISLPLPLSLLLPSLSLSLLLHFSLSLPLSSSTPTNSQLKPWLLLRGVPSRHHKVKRSPSQTSPRSMALWSEQSTLKGWIHLFWYVHESTVLIMNN